VKLALLLFVGILTAGCRFLPSLSVKSTPEPEATLRPPTKFRLRVSSPAAVPAPETKAGWGITDLTDVSGGKAVGKARRFHDRSRFVHKLLVENLPPLSPSQFYEGWLVRGKPGAADFDFIPTGRLKADQTPGVYYLYFESPTGYGDYNQVVVTREIVDDDQPEVHVMEGSF
jgi:hypothetical protein